MIEIGQRVEFTSPITGLHYEGVVEMFLHGMAQVLTDEGRRLLPKLTEVSRVGVASHFEDILG